MPREDGSHHGIDVLFGKKKKTKELGAFSFPTATNNDNVLLMKYFYL